MLCKANRYHNIEMRKKETIPENHDIGLRASESSYLHLFIRYDLLVKESFPNEIHIG